MIRFENVTFEYARGEKASGIYDINLTVNDGETVLLCGESGCGKTTLTRLVNGLIPNYYEGKLAGSVRIDGSEVGQMPLHEAGKLVGSVFQNPRSQFFNVDTTSELAFGCENRGLPAEEIKSRIRNTVAEFGIQKLVDRSIFQLSGGEKQKIACASVSACEPKIFVLDEPSSNLDMAAVEDLRKMLALWKRGGKTILIAEHRLYYLRELADRIVYMKDGRIERVFSAAEFRQMKADDLAAFGLRTLCLETLKTERSAVRHTAGRITLSNFRFSYRGAPDALKIDTLNVPAEAAVAVVGPNGAGKSTFARCLCGLARGCNGTLEREDTVYKGKRLIERCYLVMQDANHQLFAESVLDEVLLSMKKQDEAAARKILSWLDLLPLSELHPMSLSGGQKQRVAVAGAIAAGKDFLLFDEPTSGLDLKHMRSVARVLRKLRDSGKTLFIISHDLEFILESCTHVLQMENGRIAGNYPLDAAGEERLKAAFLAGR